MLKNLIAVSALGVAAVGLTLGASTEAFASSGATTFDVPISTVGVNPCNGAIVSLTGTVHFVVNAVSNGNTQHYFVLHDTLHVAGTASDGTAYLGNGGDVENLNIAAGSTESILRHFTLISEGSDPNLAFSLHEHVTVDANGNVTAFFDNNDFECTP
jgi:hypothetical protein